MADYSAQVDELRAAAHICERHAITTPVNGIQPDYPRWPAPWAACERVWRAYLDLRTMDGPDDENERADVLRAAGRLRGF